jgi:hypothetical protein
MLIRANNLLVIRWEVGARNVSFQIIKDKSSLKNGTNEKEEFELTKHIRIFGVDT